MTTTTTTTVDLPTRFYEDHCGRDLPGGVIIKTLSRTVRVELDRPTYDEILSDAQHYASGAMDDMYEDDFATASALIASAKATVRRLEAAPRPLT
jgi:hypothetical protein